MDAASDSFPTVREYGRRPTRREFLHLASVTGAYLSAGSSGLDVLAAEPMPCTPGFENGDFQTVEAFASEGTGPFGEPRGSGLGGYLLTDLRQADQNNLVTPNDQFYIRTRYPGHIDPSREWAIRVHGLVESERVLTMDDLLPAAVDQGVRLLECSGNNPGAAFGLLSAARWAGVPAHDLLSMVTPKPEATRVRISGFDEHTTLAEGSVPGASWVFTLAELAEAFFAVEMNGEPLPEDHGKPIRLFVPGWFGCTCIKWVNEIVFVDDEEPATSQMREFAERTHQNGTPALARDYAPALIDTAAMPVRIERWRIDGKFTRRIMGIVWGGDEVDLPLSIGIGWEGGPQHWEPVFVCPEREHHRTWGLWWHQWTPRERGLYKINMSVDDPAVRTRRLDSGYYTRTVRIRSA